MRPITSASIIIVLFIAGIGGGYFYLNQNSGQPANAQAETNTTLIDSKSSEHGKSVVIPENAAICAEHHIPEVICPFCKTLLIDELGHCGTHNVAEALCTRCNPILIAAFKVENDWCAEHGLPESQCTICRGSELTSADGTKTQAQVCAKHNVPESICPFCDPSLIAKLGHCGGHDVPEAFCTRCNAALIPAFKAERDWCDEHGLPESQCLVCNPPSSD